MLINDFVDSFIDFEYLNEYSCEKSGCEDDGICRCSSIIDINIKNIKLSQLTDIIYEYYLPVDRISRKRDLCISKILYGGESVDKYCIYRILSNNKVYIPNNWELKIVSGYYGQEISGSIMNNEIFYKIRKEIKSLFSLKKLSDKIKYTLKLEYGYLSDNIINSDFEIISIYKKDIDIESLNKNHFLNTKKEDLSHYSRVSYNLPRGIVKKMLNGYSIIDGYHRIESINDDNLFEVFLLKNQIP
jgi:hypothetical protein